VQGLIRWNLGRSIDHTTLIQSTGNMHQTVRLENKMFKARRCMVRHAPSPTGTLRLYINAVSQFLFILYSPFSLFTLLSQDFSLLSPCLFFPHEFFGGIGRPGMATPPPVTAKLVFFLFNIFAVFYLFNYPLCIFNIKIFKRRTESPRSRD